MILRNVLSFLAVLAIGAMVASPAEAGGGGGGAKGKNGTVRVLNNGTGNGVGLILQSGTSLSSSLDSVAKLQAAGGVVINPGQVLQFKVAGPGTAFVAPIVSGTGIDLAGASSAGYSGAQNQTGYMVITGSSTAPVIAGSAGKF